MIQALNLDKFNHTAKWLLKAAIIFFGTLILIALLAVTLYLVYEKKYELRIYPNVIIGGMNVGGKTVDEAEKIINEKVDKINQAGIVFFYNEKKAAIMPTITSIDGDFAYDVITFDTKKTLEAAFDIGRDTDKIANFKNRLGLLWGDIRIPLKYELNEEKLKDLLSDSFPQARAETKNAELTIEDGKALIKDETLGLSINYAKATADIRQRLAVLDENPIKIEVETVYPQVYKKDFLDKGIDILAQEFIDRAPYELNHGKDSWKIKKEDFAGWVTLKNSLDICASGTLEAAGIASTTEDEMAEFCYSFKGTSDNAVIGLDEAKVMEYITKNISPKTDKEPSESKFEVKEGRVTEFQVASSGKKADPVKNFKLIEYNFAGKKATTSEIVVDKVESEFAGKNLNDLGIEEIIGTGKSNFAGSPKNRRHNIKIGASRLHGVLIKPDEEFSLIKALGKIDGTTGYLPELVIKNNRTIPEYGGGLCQIGTTIFRATVNTGLPVTARQNHSYRVSYYEPAGTDATIYDPWPDYRFKNDTGHYVLIQMRMSGNDLYFDLWGKKDGRKVTVGKPIISNIVKPGPTKLIETTDLKPGEKKCTEKPHSGANAYFDYKVVYPDGTVKDKRFSSYYKPWREVCLIGVEKVNGGGGATSTPATTNDEKKATSTP